MSQEMIEIVSPVGQSASKKTGLAPRNRDSLNGLRIGLLDNNKPNADKFLDFVGELLQERYHRYRAGRQAQDDADGSRMACRELIAALRRRDQRLRRLRFVHVVEYPRLGQARKRRGSHGDGGDDGVS